MLEQKQELKNKIHLLLDGGSSCLLILFNQTIGKTFVYLFESKVVLSDYLSIGHIEKTAIEIMNDEINQPKMFYDELFSCDEVFVNSEVIGLFEIDEGSIEL